MKRSDLTVVAASCLLAQHHTWWKSSGQTIERLNIQQASSQPQPQPPTLIAIESFPSLTAHSWSLLSSAEIRLDWDGGESVYMRVCL